MKRNPVAKFAHKVNKATVHRDRTKYHRKKKHRGDGWDDRRRPFSWNFPGARVAGPVFSNEPAGAAWWRKPVHFQR